MSKMTPTDFQQRADAVDPSRSFLVQAPAGSGKTELLTDRLLALLALVQKPEEIVAITFTRAAAAEMHARVIEKLQSALGPEPEESHRKQSWQLAQNAMANNAKQGWDLLAHPARLSIRTIDALCSHLVRAMPFVSGLGGVPEVSEQSKGLHLKAAQATIAMADENDSVCYLIEHLGVNIASLEQLLVDMLGMRDQWLPQLSGVVQMTDVLYEHLQDTITEHLEHLAGRMPMGWQDLAPCAVYANENLVARGNHNLQALATWSADDPLEPVPEDLARWQALIPFFTTSGALRKPRGISATAGFPADGDTVLRKQMQQWLDAEQPYSDAWVQALTAIQYLPAEYTEKQLELLGHLAPVLMIAVAQLRLAFMEARQVDFIEISQRALSALSDGNDGATPSELLLRLDRRISHLLVDEFQDTSFNQVALLKRLISGWEPDDGRTVFLVGDPMQSIYRFRKAEVGLFLEVQESKRLGDVALEPLVLTNNFRSTANVVDWVNALGAQLFPKEVNVDLGAVAYNPSMAFNSEQPHSVVAAHPFVYKKDDADIMDAAQARLAAEQRVVELCKQALEQYPQSTKPAVVLVKARSHLGEVIRTLNAEGIATKAVDIDVLTERPVVQDIVQLVRALSHPGDRLAWLSLLRSPICGLRLHSLHALCGHDRHSTIPALLRALLDDPEQQKQWDAGEWQRLLHVSAVLLDESYQSGSLPFAAKVEHCWQRLGGEQAYFAVRDRIDAENVFQLLEKTAPYGNLDLDLFEEQVEQLFATAQDAEQAVEVMTIHKAKGLEFETVIIYDVNRKAPNLDSPLLSIEQSHGRLYVGMAKASDSKEKDAISLFIREREKQRAAYELQRLLYVAVTRARSQLHLVAIIESNKDNELKPENGSLLTLLWPLVEADFKAAAPLVKTQLQTEVTPAAHTLLQRFSSIDALPAVRTRSAPRGVNQWQWVEQPFKEAAIGTVAHAWLERIGRDGREQWHSDRIQQSQAVITRQLLRAGVVKDEALSAVVEVQDTLIRTLNSERGQWLLDAAKAHREWTLLDAEGRVSIIDLAISQDNEWLIVDYKTSMPHADQTEAEFLDLMRTRYAAQLRRYCDQVMAMDGRHAKAALYFPRADLWCEI